MEIAELKLKGGSYSSGDVGIFRDSIVTRFTSLNTIKIFNTSSIVLWN